MTELDNFLIWCIVAFILAYPTAYLITLVLNKIEDKMMRVSENRGYHLLVSLLSLVITIPIITSIETNILASIFIIFIGCILAIVLLLRWMVVIPFLIISTFSSVFIFFSPASTFIYFIGTFYFTITNGDDWKR